MRALQKGRATFGRTLHVALAFVHDEGVATALVLLVADDADALDCAVHLELAAEVLLSRLLGLRAEQKGGRTVSSRDLASSSTKRVWARVGPRTSREMKRVL